MPTPDGRVLTTACPPELGGLHFGPCLRAFILYQHHHCHVPQPKLHEQLREWGLDLFVGQIDALLASGQEAFIWAYSADLKAYRSAPAPENTAGSDRVNLTTSF